MSKLPDPRQTDLPRERRHFRSLILGNPNYFGNIKGSSFQPVMDIQANRSYESIGCVGFQPQFDRLETVVFVHKNAGYGGDVCSRGTPEYVRFYLSHDDGKSWQDLGLTSFTAYDIPFRDLGKRLEYAVTLPIHPRRRLCFVRNICRVRAILSWNVPPPPNTPDFIPVWGDIHNTFIKVEPLRRFHFGDLIEASGLKLSPELLSVLDQTGPLPAALPKVLGALELQELYQGQDVEPHRFALPEIQQLMEQPTLSESLMATSASGVLSGVKIDWPGLADQLSPGEGNTRYEQLECTGLNAEQDTLVGVLRIRQSSGYSGGPCTAGSREYVAFWADTDGNGSFDTYLGTTSVNVHDVDGLPQEGLEYAVFLPVDLNRYRQPCKKGPRLMRIRAVLSWQVAPPPANPDFVPVWGNRDETLIHIRPGTVHTGHAPYIESVGRVQVTHINGLGLANGGAAGFTPVNSPFGGLVLVSGHIANGPDISNGAAPLRYRVSVSNDGGVLWQALTNVFTVGRTQLAGGVWSPLPDATQSDVGGGYYEYREDLAGGPGNAQIFVTENILAHWHTSGLTGVWQLRMEVTDGVTTYYGDTLTIRLDNQAPQFPAGTFKITSGGGSCADFTIGDVIEGTYEATDEHFGSLSLSLLPSSGGTFTAPVPLPRSYPLVPTTGEAGTWKLDTTGLPKCGYVVRLSASDRTVVNSGAIGWYNETSVGLCLRAKGS